MFLGETQKLATIVICSPLTILCYYRTNLSLFLGKIYPPLLFGEETELQYPPHL